MSKISDRSKKKTQIKSHERGARVKFVDDVVVIKNRKTVKFVVDVFEGDFNYVPYMLEMYCYESEVINDAVTMKKNDYILVRYKTKSKRNKKTGLFYTTNTCVKITPATEETILNFNKHL